MTNNRYIILQRGNRLNEVGFCTAGKVQKTLRRSDDLAIIAIKDKVVQSLSNTIERNRTSLNNIKQYISSCLPQEGSFNSGVYPAVAAITSERTFISSRRATLTGETNHPKYLTRSVQNGSSCGSGSHSEFISESLSTRKTRFQNKILEGLPM